MFHESLLDSSLSRHDRKRWPMVTAFVLESMVAGLIVTLPLVSTGVIPVSARVPRVTPLPDVRVVASEPPRGTHGHSAGIPRPTTTVVTISDNVNTIRYGPSKSQESNENTDPNFGPWQEGPGPILETCPNCQKVVTAPAPQKPVLVSELSPAQLVHWVEPLYPGPAVSINLQGEVKLHAIIARDGTIQSLSVTSGHPLLAQAALEAVKQWRYRPYVLNGQPVEVETFVTVSFRRDR